MSASFTPYYRALRYLTAPNMALNDGKNHNPGIDNSGPFLMMNPFSSRCCQHNQAAGWVYYVENSWMASADNGFVAQLYLANEVEAKVSDGTIVKIKAETKYPFEDEVRFLVQSPKEVSFLLYFRIPSWCSSPSIKINGKKIQVLDTSAIAVGATGYLKISNRWKNGDKIILKLPMELNLRKWEKNKNSVSLNYGPLTYSLKIKEDYISTDSRSSAQQDARWQEGADSKKWPAFEIHPGSDWNYGLLVEEKNLAKSFKVVKKSWPSNNEPFTNSGAPIEIVAKGKQLPDWKLDQY